MVIVKDKMKAKNGEIHIKLPEEFKDRMVEVVVRLEDEVVKNLLIDKVKIDTTEWKFNREEIYGT